MSRSPAMEAWIDRARRRDCLDVVAQFAKGHVLKVTHNECMGPCPVCGGTDRFSITRRKNLWNCRGAGKGGDAIALAEYILACDFLAAVEALTGEPAPSGEKGKGPDAAELERRRRAAEERDAAAARDEIDYRAREIGRARKIWDGAAPLSGSLAEAYLRWRGLSAPPEARLRAHATLAYWDFRAGAFHQIHEGPALVAAIGDAQGRFIGCHLTYLARDGAGKLSLADPETGELLAAKKVRGSQKGGHIHLAGPADAPAMIVGEGIETVLSVREALIAAGRGGARLYWAAVNLGNLGGKALDRLRHPSQTRTDRRGRVRPVMVPGVVPDLTDAAVLMPPATVREATILGDGDSDRFTTSCTLTRCGRRWAAAGVAGGIAWADDGTDFNVMLMADA